MFYCKSILQRNIRICKKVKDVRNNYAIDFYLSKKNGKQSQIPGKNKTCLIKIWSNYDPK